MAIKVGTNLLREGVDSGMVRKALAAGPGFANNRNAGALLAVDGSSDDDDDDDDANVEILRFCDAFGMSPNEAIAGLHYLKTLVANLQGFQEQEMLFALSSALGSGLTEVDITSSSTAVSVTAKTGFSGVHLDKGIIEISAFRPGNSEGGEIIAVKVKGRQATDEVYRFNAGGQPFKLAWIGPFIQTVHTIEVYSAAGDATNPVRVAFTARAKPPGIEAAKVGRRIQPEVRKVARSARTARVQASAKIAMAAATEMGNGVLGQVRGFLGGARGSAPERGSGRAGTGGAGRPS